MATPDDVLAFWIGTPSTTAEELRAKMRRWYMGGSEEDARIAAQFGADVESALAGDLDAWADSPRGRVALIVLLDQFTRSVFRDQPKAFAGDPSALRFALAALDRGEEAGLAFEERQFLLMPLLHAENLAALERLVPAMRAHVNACPPWAQPLLDSGNEQTAKYRAVVARFGRFPHRNAALGRETTEEERVFLVAWEAEKRPKIAAELAAEAKRRE